MIVWMFTLRKWLSTEAKGELLPSQECTIYFIIPKLLSGKKQYVNGAGEEDSVF